MAKTMRKRNSDFTLDELEAWGREGLIDAARRFDRKRGVKFMAFAHNRVKGAMRDGMRNFRPGKRARKELGNPTPSSIDSIDYEIEDQSRMHSDITELKDQAEHLVSKLNPRMETIIRLRFWKSKTLVEIAEYFQLSEARIHQLYHQALNVLKALAR